MAYGSSAADRLVAVRAAIDKVLNAQSYGVGPRNTRYAELEQLAKLEARLEQEAQMESDGGSMTKVGVRVPAS